MSLFTTPSQLKNRSLLYQRLAVFSEAGIGTIQGIQTLANSPPESSLKEPLQKIVERLENGSTLTESFSELRGHLGDFDLELIHASEQSGRLDSCFRVLSGFYEAQARMLKQVISNLMYPVFIIHFAILIFPLSAFTDLVLKSQVDAYIGQKVMILGPLYAGFFVLASLWQQRQRKVFRSFFERILSLVPILGGAIFKLNIARLSMALEAMISAGISITQAWASAARACGSPRIEKAVEEFIPQIDSGGITPGELVERSQVFPDVFSQMYMSGELSGKLDSMLVKSNEIYFEEGSQSMETFAKMLPRLIYFGVVLMIGYQIVNYYIGYFGQLNEIMGP